MEFLSLYNIKKTEVFDTYWKFAYERQKIFFKKIQGYDYPWTTDKVLQKYKFTNAYRASDRISQYLIKNVIYSFNNDTEDLLFRILLFKIFNKISTWEYLENHMGQISFKNFSKKNYSLILKELYDSKNKLYSGAYIMPSGKREFGHTKKYENHLDLLEFMFKNNISLKIDSCKNLKELYIVLLNYPTIGPFLAYQYAIDINYSNICDFDEMDFVVAGPGAISGISKCFIDIGNYNTADIIKYMSYNQEAEFQRLNLNFQNLNGRRLQLIDCQNLFCETDKYARVIHPSIHGNSNRKKIKQIYIPNNNKIEYFYPPKWNINSF